MIPARRRALPLLPLALSLCAACAPQGAPPARSLGVPGSMQRPIVGGTADTNPAHSAVVLVYIKNMYMCTGTVVAPNVVVTAAHCTYDEMSGTPLNSPSSYQVLFDTNHDTNPGETYSAVTEVHRHPSYVSNWNNGAPKNDIAVLRIAKTPTSVTPIPVLPHSLSSSVAKGVTVEFAGYGLQKYPGINCCDENNQPAGCSMCPSSTLFHASNAISGVCTTSSGCSLSGIGFVPPGVFCYDQQPGGPCSGDSGGPAFLTVSGKNYVVGVTSYGDQNCYHFGCSTKADEFASFLAPFLGSQKPLGQSCSAAADCQSGFCVDGVCCNTACDAQCQGCSTSVGAASNGTCQNVENMACEDLNPCTLNDVCHSGLCRGTTKNCGASSPCKLGGSCNLSTGACESGANKADGTSCDDGNACTTNDTCQAGACQPGPDTCPPPDPCQGKADGTACDDGDACTRNDFCLSNKCSGENPVICAAPDACHEPGECDWQTGKCAYRSKPNGTTCDDGDDATSDDQCQGGTCAGTSACAGQDDGTACPGGLCQEGACVPAPVVTDDGCGCGAAGAGTATAFLGLAGLLALGRRSRNLRLTRRISQE